MSQIPVNTLIQRALQGETTERTPIWMMRQAGRTDPEYLRIRDESNLSLEELFRNPEYATTFSLLPKRIGVDAIIFYQDILTPLSPMGAHFVFRPGPVLEKPLEHPDDLDAIQPYDAAAGNPFVGETFARLQESLQGELPVFGFAGAPLTLAVFIMEGKSFGATASKAMAWLAEAPEKVHACLDRITTLTISYLKYQASVGATAVQLFESCAFLLSREQYAEFALPYQQRIFEALKDVVPTINFARDWPHIDDLEAAGADVISLPGGISIATARETLGVNAVVQGNVDNKLLVHGSKAEIEEAVRACVLSGEHRGHIFNLSHGLLRETPFENVRLVVDTVRSISD